MEKIIAAIIGLVLGVCLLAAIVALPFMLIWNYAVVSAIEVTNPINFWQALCFVLLFTMFNYNYKKSE